MFCAPVGYIRIFLDMKKVTKKTIVIATVIMIKLGTFTVSHGTPNRSNFKNLLSNPFHLFSLIAKSLDAAFQMVALTLTMLTYPLILKQATFFSYSSSANALLRRIGSIIRIIYVTPNPMTTPVRFKY